jgi:ferredoxin
MTLSIILSTGSLVALFWLFAERGRLLQPSTRKLMREQGLKNILNFTALHSYIYLRWTRQYIRIALRHLLPVSNEWGRKKWSDRYHGKVLTGDQAREIITLNRKIDRDLEQIIPYPTARDLVLNGPPDVVVIECVCRAAAKSPCKPSQVCMVIGQPFADFLLEHHPQTSRRLAQAEALTLLEQEHLRGHVHVAWFKDVMLNRFYAICNCCSCCCGGITAMVNYGMPTAASSGYVAKADPAACIGCGTCEKTCPFRAVRVEGKATVQWEKCMGCGICESRCPEKAMTLLRDERKGIPLDVKMMQ